MLHRLGSRQDVVTEAVPHVQTLPGREELMRVEWLVALGQENLPVQCEVLLGHENLLSVVESRTFSLMRRVSTNLNLKRAAKEDEFLFHQLMI